MQTKSQGEIFTSTAIAPADALITKSAGDHEHVDEDDVLEPERVGGLQRDEGEQARDRERAEDADDRERAEPERDGEQRRQHAGRSSPRAIGRRRLTGCCRSASMSRRSLTR